MQVIQTIQMIQTCDHLTSNKVRLYWSCVQSGLLTSQAGFLGTAVPKRGVRQGSLGGLRPHLLSSPPPQTGKSPVEKSCACNAQ